MLQTIECQSLEDLMDKVMPASIVDKNPDVHEGKSLDNQLSENEYL